MDKRIILVLGLSIYVSVTFASGGGGDRYYSKTRPYRRKEEVVTNLHFFFHDKLSSPNATPVLIAKKPNNQTAAVADDDDSPTPFGTLFAVDDPLTTGPHPSSHRIGSAMGMYVSSGQDLPTLSVFFDFGFTEGEFSGSSISVFSRNPITDDVRELAVVGGRGRFRMATGTALLNTHSVDLHTGDAVVEYNVTLIHY